MINICFGKKCDLTEKGGSAYGSKLSATVKRITSLSIPSSGYLVLQYISLFFRSMISIRLFASSNGSPVNFRFVTWDRITPKELSLADKKSDLSPMILCSWASVIFCFGSVRLRILFIFLSDKISSCRDVVSEADGLSSCDDEQPDMIRADRIKRAGDKNFIFFSKIVEGF